jgi:cbb3-type cytochrome oxidase cytochrome c subunit/cbb3-type cytochrome oxidase subunit 1
VAADSSPKRPTQPKVEDDGATITSRYVLIATALFVFGIGITALASLQLVLPELLADSPYTTYGRLSQAGRTLLADGWLPIAGLGLAAHALVQIAGTTLKRRTLATAALIAMAFGAIATAGAIVAGLSSGIVGQEGPIWSRAISVVGYLLAALVITATAKQKADGLGPAGWYLTAASWWLAASGAFGLIPLMTGTAGSIQSAFANVGVHRLFVVTMAVGLLYFAFSRISGADLSESRPLAALGFWSLALTWALMGGVDLVYSATPDWYETLTISFAIGTLVPALAITTDLGLLLKGHVQDIGDRATLRYGIVGGLALIGATIVNLLLAWRATSAVVQFTTWTAGVDVLLVLGGGSFAIFAANSLRRGGRASGTSLHFSWSVIGVAGAAVGLLAGGVVTGFSWIASPSSQLFPNYGPGYEVAVVSLEPFLWIAAISLTLYAAAQIVYLVRINASSDEGLATPDGPLEYDLEFEGSMRYVTWRRLVWGAVVVWMVGAVFTAALPMMDTSETDATITADRFRTYEPGTPQLTGRDVYISQGCAACHTQSVRPIVTDVGLGAVSIAGDYAHENPAMMTGTRFGPDLTHIASREGFSPASVDSQLRDPRASRPWSIMPSYSHLSDADINALVSYIETLR